MHAQATHCPFLQSACPDMVWLPLQGSGVCRPTEQISRSMFADTPVGGFVARVPQEATPPDTQATAPALLSHETSNVTVSMAAASPLCSSLACCCVSLMCMLSSQSDVAFPPSPVLLIRQPEELGTVSITPALISRPRSRWQKVSACQSEVAAAQRGSVPFTDSAMPLPACLGA